MPFRLNQISSFFLIIAIMLFFFYNSTFVNKPLQETNNLTNSLKQYQAQLHRDVLRYRSGKINQYDTLNKSLSRIDDASRSISSFNSEHDSSSLTQSINILVNDLRLQRDLIENFKTYNAVAHNSLLYFYRLSNDYYESHKANNEALENTIGKLTTLILAYTTNPTHMKALDIYPIIDQLNNNPGFKLKTIINHSLMIVEKFPELDLILNKINELNIENTIESVLDQTRVIQLDHEKDAKIFNALLFICSLYLCLYVGILFTNLQRSRNTLADSNSKLNNEVSVRTQTESALTELVKNSEEGKDKIQALTYSITRALKIRCVYISYLNQDGTANINGVLDGQQIHEHTYDLRHSPCAEVIEKGRLFYNDGFKQYFHQWNAINFSASVSYFGVAIRSEDNETIGVLAAIDDKPMSNTLLFENILNLAASKAKIEIERAFTIEKSGRYQKGLLAIENWSAEALLNTGSDYDLHDAACEVALNISHSSLAAFPVLHTDKEKYRFVSARGDGATNLFDSEYSINDGGLCAYTIKNNETTNIDDVKCDLRCKKQFADQFDISSAFVTPINFNGDAYGALSLFKQQGQFDEIDKRLIGQLSKSIEILLTNNRLLSDLESEKERAEVTLHSIGDAVITTNVAGEIEYMNHIAEALTNWTLDETKGMPVQQVFRIFDHETSEPLHDLVDICLGDGIQITKSMTTLLSKNNIEKEIESSMSPITGKDRKTQGIVIVFHDETEKRHMEHIIRHQATHDALTGLANRNEFDRELSEHIHDASNHDNREHALCYLDLDRFKLINDTSGHAAGDELLKQVTRILQSCLRSGDVIGRLGGDEFGIILENCNLVSGKQIAQKIISELGDFQFNWDNNLFTIGVSIGLVSITAETSNSVELMKHADVACYTAKDSGRNRVYIYQQEDAEMVKRHEQMHWASRISNALDNDKFVLYAQQICPLGSSDTQQHIEILVRMLDDNNEIIAPGSFIPAAERYNLMSNVDKYIIDNVFHYIRKQGEDEMSYSINLSGNSLNEDDLTQFIKDKLVEYDVRASRICFEITETSAITNIYKARKLMFELREIGCQFSLDDFGSGLSSFEYLKNLPVDYLKIDGSFVQDMVDNKTDHAMVAAINEIGHVMGIKTIAEFVENDNIIHKLRQIGVDFVQGYGVHRPCPLIEIPNVKLVNLNKPVAGYV